MGIMREGRGPGQAAGQGPCLHPHVAGALRRDLLSDWHRAEGPGPAAASSSQASQVYPSADRGFLEKAL